MSVMSDASLSPQSLHHKGSRSISNQNNLDTFLIIYTTRAIYPSKTMASLLKKSPSSVDAVLRDASHFTQKSSVKPVKDKSGLSATDLTSTVSLNLDDPEVKEAARALLLKDPTLAAEAVAEYPELQKYINEGLDIKIPKVQTPSVEGRAAVPVPRTVTDDDNEAKDGDVDDAERGLTVLDNLLRRTKTSLDAKGGGNFSMVRTIFFVLTKSSD